MKDTDPSLDKVPPNNLEAEKSILGSILRENSSINTVWEILSIHDFHSEAHRKIFSTFLDLCDRNKPIDMNTLSNALKDKGLLDSVGGTTYLSSLVNSTPSIMNVADYAKIVKEKSILRGLIDSLTDILVICYEAGADVDKVLARAEQSIFEISENRQPPSFYPTKTIVQEKLLAI